MRPSTIHIVFGPMAAASLEMEGDLVYERIRETTWFTFRLPLAREPSTAVLTASL